MPISFDSPALAWTALAVSLLALAIVRLRRVDLPPSTAILISLGLLLITLSAANPRWLKEDEGEVLVMVDHSASTRTARYRDETHLNNRLSTLLRNTKHRILYFAEANQQNRPPGDLPADQTRFSPPNGTGPILLFSDARFALPQSFPRPIYIPVDPMLEDPEDAAVAALDLRGQTASITLHNASKQPRRAAIESNQPEELPLAPGTIILNRPLDSGELTIRVDRSDPWPENDSLSIRPPPAVATQRWWRGPNPPASFTPIANLPNDAADYLTPTLIVLNNTPADALSPQHQDLLHQYVRDLGGSLLILGGDRAFAAGQYPGTPLETLSPLASTPPSPTLQWILLADASGSMAAPADGGTTRWDQARSALTRLLPALPPNDPVDIGHFAESLTWWSRSKSARDTAATPLPDVSPRGPTNLEPALLRLLSESTGAMPTELLLLTDADVEISNPTQLSQGLAQKRIRLHLLLLGKDARGRATLEQLARASGGSILEELDPKRWADSAKKLLSTASAKHLHTDPTDLRFERALAQLPPRRIPQWNRLWLKDGATQLAAATHPELPPMLAHWPLGNGQVLSAAFPPSPAELDAMARLIEQPPKDPRLTLRYHPGPTLRITIDAVDAGRSLNNQRFSLQLGQDRHDIPQSAPGRYELTLPSPRQPTIALLRHENRIINRHPLPGRYPPEFDAIGNDRRAMTLLTEQSNGHLIPPTDNKPLDFHWPRRPIPLTPWTALAGAAMIALGLARWRLW